MKLLAYGFSAMILLCVFIRVFWILYSDYQLRKEITKWMEK